MIKRILIVSSTLPAHSSDPVPAFIREQAEWFKRSYPNLEVAVLAPHNAYAKTANYRQHPLFKEYRFHYFWPFKWELLTGRGIMPALHKNRLLYLQLPFLFVAEIFAIWRYVKKFEPDLLYAHWFAPQAIAASLVGRFTNTPYVFTTHASDVIVLSKVPLIKHLVWSVCKKALGYTAVSEYTAERLLNVGPVSKRRDISKKLQIIPMGTEMPAALESSSLEKARRLYNPGGDRLILFMGRLASIKGVDNLLTAFAEIRKKHSHVKLIIAGEGLERKRLENRASSLGLDRAAVEFTGFVKGYIKHGLLSMADVVCLPSKSEGRHAEGLPIVFMEGLRAGAIIVASNVSGGHQYIKDGVNGFIFTQRDTAHLSRVLLKALALEGDAKAKMIKHSASLGQRFEWEQVIAEHYKFFAGLTDA